MSTIDSLGRQQEVNFISEPNLYRVIFRSNKEQAKQFQNWVFNDVLPSIRKTGTYLTPKQQFLLDILDSKDDLSRAVAINKYEIGYVKPLENKADVYDAIVESKNTFSMANTAQIINIEKMGRNKLMAWLRSEEVLKNTPFQKYINKGWFEVRLTPTVHLLSCNT